MSRRAEAYGATAAQRSLREHGQGGVDVDHGFRLEAGVQVPPSALGVSLRSVDRVCFLLLLWMIVKLVTTNTKLPVSGVPPLWGPVKQQVAAKT